MALLCNLIKREFLKNVIRSEPWVFCDLLHRYLIMSQYSDKCPPQFPKAEGHFFIVCFAYIQKDISCTMVWNREKNSMVRLGRLTSDNLLIVSVLVEAPLKNFFKVNNPRVANMTFLIWLCRDDTAFLTIQTSKLMNRLKYNMASCSLPTQDKWGRAPQIEVQHV